LNKTQTGRLGEQLAEEYLLDQGFQIITKNFHSLYGEIDIIAKKNGKLHFIEVKSRRNSSFGLPVESYTYIKQQKIIKTAFIYMDQQDTRLSFQFDFISILLDQEDGTKEIKMMENALYE
jgi:putative endonuclease